MKIGVDIQNADWLAQQGPSIAARAKELTRRVMELHGRAIVDEAGNILDRTTRGDGLLALGLDAHTAFEGETVATEFTWDQRYGPIMEYGPEVESWVIEAKYAQALRFPILSDTGEVQKVQYVARGHQILFQWRNDMLRPHFNPAIDDEWDDLERDLAEVIPRAMETV